jgi:PTH1 family peptidyl-tRNA hydrolase
MKIITGLGNPGEEYQLNRHNIGFMILDKFANSRKMSFEKDGNALVAKRSLFKLIKPLTFMNLSGKAVVRFHESIEDTLVVCDDIYLPLGEIRLRQSGSDGGHNGLASVIYELETVDFSRMRIGVGKPENSDEVKHYVLENFSTDELITLEKTIEFAVKLIDCFIANGFQTMLNYYSKHKKSYSEKLLSESKSEGGK